MSNGKPSFVGNYPRITFHAPDRTFDRLFKESSLSDLKKTVRTKLGLKSRSVVQLAQLRQDQSIDLEDEDDFDAFYSVAHEQRLVNVQVTLVDNFVTEDHAPAPEERPRKKHKREHEVEAMTEDGVGSHAETHEGKKRKVAFTEPFAEVSVPARGLEEPQRKKRRDISGSITAVADSDHGSSHDGSEALKKKEDRLSYDSAEIANTKKRHRSEGQSSTSSKQYSPPSDADGPHKDPGSVLRVDGGQLQSEPEHSTFNQVESPVTTEVPTTHSRMEGAALSTSRVSPETHVSSNQKLKKKSSRRKLEDLREKEAESALSAGSPSDANSSGNRSIDSAQKDNDLARNVKDKDGTKMLDDPKDEVKRRNRRSTVNADNTTSSNSDGLNRQTGDMEAIPAAVEHTLSLVKEAATTVTRRKKSTLTSAFVNDAQEGSPDSAPVQGKAATHDKAKAPEGGVKKGARSSVPAVQASMSCLVCNKSPKHDLVDCPIVKEGPTSIQKRIKSMRASKKIPDREKLPLIFELQKIKAEQRESEKRKVRETKAIESRSQPALSPPVDEGVKDVGGHTNDVAGVSKEYRSVNSEASNNGRSSATPSLDPDAHQVPDPKPMDDDSITLPGIDDVSGFANIDLDALVKGPESSLLSINDIPSSDDDSDEDDAEKMSGEAEIDEVEQSLFVKLVRNNLADSDGSDSQGDEPANSDDGSEKPAAGSLGHTRSSRTHGLRHSKNSDTIASRALDVSGRDIIPETGKSSATTAGGKADHTISNACATSGNPIDTAEVQFNSSNGLGARQDSLQESSIEDLPKTHNKGRGKVSPAEGATNGRKHVKTPKTPKKVDGVLLSQVAKDLQDSAARNSKTPVSTTPALKTPTTRRAGRLKTKLASNRPAARRTSNEQTPTISMASDKWTAEKESSPHPDDDGSAMVDELLPSSPDATGPRPLKPVFGPSNTQSSIAFSQKMASEDLSDVEESNSEKETKEGRRFSRSWRNVYRRLSDIPPGSFGNRQAPRMTPASHDKAAELYGKGNEVETESSSNSDSEVEKPSRSHIPKKRIAGKV